MKDFYKILGVSEDADEKEIKRSFRDLALKYHPDKNQGDENAENTFKEISEAYDVLSSKEKRSHYDQIRHGPQMGDFNFNDIFSEFESFFGGRGNPFGGGSRNRRKRTVVGSSIHLQVRITPDEVLRGSSRDLSIDRSISCFNCLGRGYVSQSDVSKCSECNGSGNVKFNAGFVALTTTCNRCGGAGFTIKSPCENCHGAGIESKKDTLNVSIPKGVRESDKIRIPRFGNEEPGCEEPGDVFVSVTIDKDEKFNICGCDVESIVTIKYTDAVLGGDVRIQLIDEIAELEIPSGTSAGERFIFKGKGMPVAINNDLRGDHIIRVDIEIPKKINDEQRKAVSTLKDLDL